MPTSRLDALAGGEPRAEQHGAERRGAEGDEPVARPGRDEERRHAETGERAAGAGELGHRPALPTTTVVVAEWPRSESVSV